MYSLEVIAGMVILLLALFAAGTWIAMHRTRRSSKNPRFAEEFIDELDRLDEHTEDVAIQNESARDKTPQHQIGRPDKIEGNEGPQKGAYALYQRGEPAFRIASTLGIARADAELLIRIEESLRRNLRE